MDNSCGIGDVLRKSRSALLPRREMPLLKPPTWNPPPFAKVNEEEGVLDEMDQPLTTTTMESQNPEDIQAIVRARPLARVSASSFCLPEEEALRALARHSSSSLPSIAIGDINVPPDPIPEPSPLVDTPVQSPASVPLPESPTGSRLGSPTLAGGVTVTSSSVGPPHSPVSSTTTAVSQPDPSKYPSPSLSVILGEAFLPSPSSPDPLDEPLSRLLSPSRIVSSADDSDESFSPSFFPPPPYHAVVSERTTYHPGSNSLPPLSSTVPCHPAYQCRRQVSDSFVTSGPMRSRGRMRPPPPIGPRKPGRSGQAHSSFVPGGHGRNDSMSSVRSADPIGSPGSLWHKLHSAASKPPPMFRMPPPKWRGLTLEAAQWTFTSAQLQEVVSRAIQQASEGSSVRLLRLEVLEGEVAEEMHRLELQHTDIKAQYKALVRKRWTLMGTLAGQMEDAETSGAARTMEALAEVMLALDRLAEQMHDVVLQMAQLKSLCDVHSASALALAVRKINRVFVRQVVEKEQLQEHIDTLTTERDEAWKYAEDIAKDYDTLHDRVRAGGETRANGNGGGGGGGDVQASSSTNTANSASVGTRRSTRISAVRMSSARLSQAGLRSRSRHRPGCRSSSSGPRPASLVLDSPVPPVPRLSMHPSEGPALSTGTWSFFPPSDAHSRGHLPLCVSLLWLVRRHVVRVGVWLHDGHIRRPCARRCATRSVRDARAERSAEPGVVGAVGLSANTDVGAGPRRQWTGPWTRAHAPRVRAVPSPHGRASGEGEGKAE